jgi:hypothetical protein
MRFDAQAVYMVEIELTGCENVYGQAPCTASQGAGFECYNTFANCQDTPNYVQTPRIYQLVANQGFQPVEGTIPCLAQFPKITPAEIKQNQGLAVRGALEVQAIDFPYSDNLPDDDNYRDTRNYIAGNTGTFWGKFLARHPYYKGSVVTLKVGHWVGTDTDTDTIRITQDIITRLTQSGDYRATQATQAGGQDFDPVYVTERIYALDRIDLRLDGRAVLHCKDPMTFLDDSKVKIPTPTDATVLTQIEPQQSANIPIDAANVTYFSTPNPDGFIRINEEIIEYTGVSGNALTGITKAEFNTTAQQHLVGDGIQKLFGIESTNIVDALAEILNQWGGVDKSQIAYDAFQDTPTGTPDIWDIELEQWLQSINIEGVISSDTGLTQILNEMCQQTGLVMWWNGEKNQIYINANKFRLGAESQPTIGDSEIAEGTFSMKEDRGGFITQLWTYYGLINPLEGVKPTNFQNAYVAVNTDLESANALGGAQIAIKYANWLEAGALGTVITLATRALNESSFPRYRFNFKVDTQVWPDLDLGDYFILDSRYVQGPSGENVPLRCRIVKLPDQSVRRYRARWYAGL